MLFLSAILRVWLPREPEANDLLAETRLKLGNLGLTIIALVYVLSAPREARLRVAAFAVPAILGRLGVRQLRRGIAPVSTAQGAERGFHFRLLEPRDDEGEIVQRAHPERPVKSL